MFLSKYQEIGPLFFLSLDRRGLDRRVETCLQERSLHPSMGTSQGSKPIYQVWSYFQRCCSNEMVFEMFHYAIHYNEEFHYSEQT